MTKLVHVFLAGCLACLPLALPSHSSADENAGEKVEGAVGDTKTDVKKSTRKLKREKRKAKGENNVAKDAEDTAKNAGDDVSNTVDKTKNKVD